MINIAKELKIKEHIVEVNIVCCKYAWSWCSDDDEDDSSETQMNEMLMMMLIFMFMFKLFIIRGRRFFMVMNSSESMSVGGEKTTTMSQK